MIQVNWLCKLLFHILHGLVPICGLWVFVKYFNCTFTWELVFQFDSFFFVKLTLFHFRDGILVFFVVINVKEVVYFTFVIQKTLLHRSISIRLIFELKSVRTLHKTTLYPTLLHFIRIPINTLLKRQIIPIILVHILVVLFLLLFSNIQCLHFLNRIICSF